MLAFWIIAGLLALAASGLVTWPLWRGSDRQPVHTVTLWGLLVFIPVVASVLYGALSTWDWRQPVTTVERASEVAPVDQMTQALADRLARSPEDPNGWQLLGRSYVALGDYPAALRAYQQAWVRVEAPDNTLKLALAEAQALTDRDSLLGEAGQLVEEVLSEEPRNARALWYGGMAAALAQRHEVAKDRWRLLLTLSPPEPVARTLREQLAALGDAPAVAVAGASAEAATPAEGGFQVRVSVAEVLGAEAIDGASQLFILARNPQGGPPLAVVRHPPSRLPGVFSLSDADAMIPGSSLANFEQLNFVARLSRSGQPLAQSGDLFGEALYRKGSDTVIELVIDQSVD